MERLLSDPREKWREREREKDVPETVEIERSIDLWL
jgi:hypothetical protein